MKLIFVNWDTEKVVSWSALIVAVCSMIATYMELSTTREHQRLSVKPILEFYRHSSNSDKGYLTKFAIANTGLGPARIGNFEVFIDGKRVHTYESIKNKIITTQKIEKKKISYSISTSDIWNGRIIKPEQEIFFLIFENGNFAKYATEFFNEHSLSINLCYCSLYNECENFNPKKGIRKSVDHCKWSKETSFYGYDPDEPKG